MTGGFESQSAASVRRRYGRLAGALFVGASLLIPPSLLAIQPYVDASQRGIQVGIYGIAVAGLITGIWLLRAPWERLSDRWLHFGPAMAIPQILMANLITHGHSNFFYVLIVGYAALVFRSRKVVAAYVLCVWAAMFLPLLIRPEDNGVTMGVGLVGAPTIAALALMTVALREQVERSRHAYHELAWRTIQASGAMLRTESDRDALDSLAAELIERDRESQESPIALEPRWTRRFDPSVVPEPSVVQESGQTTS
jgi:hypothetical protein